MKPKLINKQKQGVSIIEVIISSAIASIVAIFVGITVTQFIQVRNDLVNSLNKAYLAEEGYEIIRFLRDENWTNLSSLSLNNYHYLNLSTTTIAISPSVELIDDKFTRSFRLAQVYRNSQNHVVTSTTSGAVLDSDSLNLEVFVSDSKGTSSIRAMLMNFSAI